jgi:hypothetical protein
VQAVADGGRGQDDGRHRDEEEGEFHPGILAPIAG